MSIAFPIVDVHTKSPLEQSISDLRHLIRDMKQVVVAFSGGVDSALVLDIAHEVLGQNAIAMTAISPTFPPEEQEIAQTFTKERGIRHLLIETHELEEEGYARNEGNRCYFCKSELFRLATVKANAMGIRWVLDGTIVDDLGDHRPGLQAASENEVRHPLVEARFDKAMVRTVAQQRGIHVWNKPSFACLGSRFAVGTRVTLDRIVQVQKVESILRSVGCVQFRARWHEIEKDAMVRIELGASELQLVLNPEIRATIVESAKQEGFRWVTLDLMGYQQGSGSTREETLQPY
jgi:pyridinium-3,5-biscarboxylic acid mononucleotide sulfurtransferase